MKMSSQVIPFYQSGTEGLTQARLDREALSVLRRLCEKGALMAVARDMDSAVVVREEPGGGALRTAVVAREIAQAMALREWIASTDPDQRIARYTITAAGRAALRGLTAAAENRAQGFADTRANRPGADNAWELNADLSGNTRFVVVESPLVGLARRKDRDGAPFLSRELVNVGERLRQDFELADVGTDILDDPAAAFADDPAGLHPATRAARDRVQAALADLGPGLAEVVLRCCCLLEGLETTEQKLGWSARSGKIVLRIALQRLLRHYAETQGKYGPLIG